MKYFNSSINKFLSVSILLFSTNLFALSDKSKEGKELYSDATCKQCHGLGESFDVKNHKANNLNSLKGWVRGCDSALETGWFPEEQSSVVEYLNDTHYKYKTK